MKLYEFSTTRSIRVRWLLNEMGVPYESHPVNLLKGEHRNPEFLAINPAGKVPAIVDDGFMLAESAAICTYLADKYPEKKMIPVAGTEERALFNQWMYYCMSELEQPLWQMIRHTFIYPENKRLPQIFALSAEDFKNTARLLEKHLALNHYIMGTQFTAVDVMIGHTLIWADGYDIPKPYALLKEFPQIRRYLGLLKDRPKLPTELRERILSA